MRYDLLSPRTRKDGKTYWHKVGAAFPSDKGGFSLVFDSLPLPDSEGSVRLIMKEYEARDTRDDYREKRPSGAPAGGDPYNGGDEIPFAPEWR